jgi:hypothetical protein
MMKLRLILPVLLLTGCASDDIADFANAGVEVAATGLEIAGAVVGASGGGGGGSGGYSSPAPTVPTSGGYSQRGAFEDCQRMYEAAGRYDLARECANRANNMGSLN